MQISVEASVSRNIRRITRFAPWDIFIISHGPRSKSTLRWAQSNDLPWFTDTPTIGPAGPAMAPCRNCLGTPWWGGGYTQVLYHSQHFKTWHPCHHVGPQHKPHQRWHIQDMRWCLPKVIQWRRSFCLLACLLVAWNWGPTTNANISAQNTKTPSHVRYCVYMSSGYLSYHTQTPAWAALNIGELENRPQKGMHITIRYTYTYIRMGSLRFACAAGRRSTFLSVRTAIPSCEPLLCGVIRYPFHMHVCSSH